jgi:hypothetical protein
MVISGHLVISIKQEIKQHRTVEKWRFSEVDYSSAFNNFGGYNAPNIPNYFAFAALKADGSIKPKHPTP